MGWLARLAPMQPSPTPSQPNRKPAPHVAHGAHDFKGLTDWVHAFSGGDQIDSQGRRVHFSHSDLDQIVANHDASAPPPHVITHDELYSPFRFGDIAEVKRDGDHLFVKSGRVSPQLESMVSGGYLPDRSLRILKTDAGYKIGHLAWLGSEPPAVEGLAPVEFAAPQVDQHDFVFGQGAPDTYTPNVMQRAWRRLREWILDREGVEAADRVMPEHEIESLGEHVDEMERESDRDDPREFSRGRQQPAAPSGATTMTGQHQFSQADIEAAEARGREAAQRETQTETERVNAELAAERAKNRRAEFAREVGELAVDGDAVRLTPAQQVGVADFMAQLDDGSDNAFEFSAGTTDKPQTKKQTPLEFFRDFVKSLGPQVKTGQADMGEAPNASTSHSFSTAQGYAADENALRVHEAALDYQAQHSGVDYVAAVNHVQAAERG